MRRFVGVVWRSAAGLLLASALQGCHGAPVTEAMPLAVPVASAPVRHADLKAQTHLLDVTRVASWIVDTKDNQGQPFAIIDKREARLFVFRSGGELVGSAPVLLGQAKGDDTVPGIGDRPLRDVKPFERTTPAGRFVGSHGPNLRGEDVIWIDYDAAVSMHPVLTTNPAEHRLQRLQSSNPEDHRISYGCVNVPKGFFNDVVLKTLAAPSPIIYVLPETKPLSAALAGFPSGVPDSKTRPAARQARGAQDDKI